MAFVMTLTSFFLVLIMLMVWKTRIFLVIAYVATIGIVELAYLSSVLYKFGQGGYVPLAFAMALTSVMFLWNDVHRRKYYYELNHKISPEKLVEDIKNDSRLCRIPGLAVFHSELVQGNVPPIFKHYMLNLSALHSVLVFVSIKSLPMSKVSDAEQCFLFGRVEPKELNIFRCVVGFGYTDYAHKDEDRVPFERVLVNRLKEFIEEEFLLSNMMVRENGQPVENKAEYKDGLVVENEVDRQDHEGQRNLVEEQKQHEGLLESEIEAIDTAWHAGVVHLIGENQVIASKESGIGKRILINYAYDFLNKNLRQRDSNLSDIIPHKRMLKIGMTYEL